MEEFLENLMNTERDIFFMENHGQKNGYYNRSMKIRKGEIKDLNVPRDKRRIIQNICILTDLSPLILDRYFVFQ